MKLKILIPMYNDWEVLYTLMGMIEKELKGSDVSADIVVIDDGSNQPFPAEKFKGKKMEIVHLARNVGHQKAVALGLAHVAQSDDFDAALVMDSDGEDRPDHILTLVEEMRKRKDKIVFARRMNRQENWVFRMFYNIYKVVFFLFTSMPISFGNFCIMPKRMLDRVTYVSEIWNHFSGGVIKSKLPFVTLGLDRGKRLAGQSKMNFSSLVLHGLSAISVHMDIVSIRLLFFAIFLISATIIGGLAVVGYGFFTEQGVPAWATNTLIGLSIIFMLAFMLFFILVFLTLSSRVQRQFIPRIHYKEYVLEVVKFG